MRIEERLGLANLAYHRAVVRAREETSRAAWRGLVTAAKNLQAARHAREGPAPRAASAGPRPDAKVLRFPVPRRAFGDRWPELAREQERARALMARSRELVRESRRLRAEVTAITGRWREARERRADG